ELDRRSEPLWWQLERELTLLVESDARIVVLACNTTQYFSDRIGQLMSGSGSKFIRMSDVIRSYVDANAAESIYAIGIGHVVDGSSWSDFGFLNHSQNAIVPNEKDTRIIETLAYEIKRFGPSATALQKLRAIVRRSPAEHVLILL